MMRDAMPLVSSDTHALCLPCAMADVQRAHAVADPHCTCPDCILSHEASEARP